MTPNESNDRPTLFARLVPLFWGLLAGVLAGIVMLACMAALRLFFFVATPTEMIFDRVFPLVTVDVFIGALARAGSYSALKLQGVFGALAGQLGAAGVGGMIYAWFVGRRGARHDDLPDGQRPVLDPRGWKLVIPGVLGVWGLFVVLLYPQLQTSYHGRPALAADVITSACMLVSFAVCGVALMLFYGLLSARPRVVSSSNVTAAPEDGLTRRRFLAAGLGALGAVALGGMLRKLFKIGSFGYDGTQYGGPEVIKLTPTDKFYQVTKNLVDPDAARDLWRFSIDGNVEAPHVWTFGGVTALPAVEQETTLQCISYGIGSGLISNAIWKGVPLPALLAQVKPKPDTTTVMFHAADGYYETFPFAKAIEPTTLLSWEMNGAPLPPHHGFPMRLIVPGIYGERSPKWVLRLELLSKDDPRLKMMRHEIEGVGFYTEQGWGPNIYVPTTSRIDAPLVRGDHFDEPFKLGQPVEIRGMAFGGDKGVSKVELSFDDGESWTDVPITEPGTLISWSLWKYSWTPKAEGECAFLVRATNGRGEPQITENRGPVPHGATGLQRVRGLVNPA